MSESNPDTSRSVSDGIGFSPPAVVEFEYSGFCIKGNKWMATCKKCRSTLTEKRGVTSAFTK